jgi:hypothetical protein
MLKRLKQNPNHKYLCHSCGSTKVFKAFLGKTYEELYGKEKALKMKNRLSVLNSGENNGMFGKPSPKGTGNGWSGWYKNWYFRSLRELSFMINYIERFNLKWQTLENKKYAIPYINYEGTKRNYFPDFLINNKYIIEVKPKKLWNSIDVKNKKDAAEKFCEKNNLIYKLIDPFQISEKIILNLYMTKQIIFSSKYEEKFKQKYLEIK